MGRRSKAAAELPPIDWVTLLVGRDSPPRQWWVGEAIQRGTSDTELRAEAALTLLLEPEGRQPEPGSCMAQLLPVAQRFGRIFQSEIHFARTLLDEEGELCPLIYRVAVDLFLRLLAASKAVNPPDRSEAAAPLVPELVEAAKRAADVVQKLQARNLDKLPDRLLEEWTAKYAAAAPAAAPAPAAVAAPSPLTTWLE